MLCMSGSGMVWCWMRIRDRQGIVHDQVKYYDDEHPTVFGGHELVTDTMLVTCLVCLAISLPDKPWIEGRR